LKKEEAVISYCHFSYIVYKFYLEGVVENLLGLKTGTRGKILHINIMDKPDHKEFRKILRRHEEVAQANCRVVMLNLSQLEELEQASN